MGKPMDLTGQQFGKWTVKQFAGRRGVAMLWRCVCACGRESDIPLGNLRSGYSTQCQHCGRTNFHHRTHGQSGSRTWNLWMRLRQEGHMDAAWEKYEDFFRDVGVIPKDHYFRRKDVAIPYGPTNWTLVSKTPVSDEELSLLKTTEGLERRRLLILYKMRGASFTQLADVMGVSLRRVKQLTSRRRMARKEARIQARVERYQRHLEHALRHLVALRERHDQILGRRGTTYAPPPGSDTLSGSDSPAGQ